MKDPYYYWYASDFMGSMFVQGLELAEECCYRRLLDAQATSSDGRISDNIEDLRKQCKRPPVAQWNKIWAKLKVKFIPHPDGAGGLINLRMHEILQEREGYLAGKSKAGKLGNEKRWGNRKAIAGPIADESQSDRKGHRESIASISISKEEEPPIVPPLRLGEFQRCVVTPDQYEKLKAKLNSHLDGYIRRFDNWVNEAPNAKQHGVKRKDRHAYESILNWFDRDVTEGKIKPYAAQKGPTLQL